MVAMDQDEADEMLAVLRQTSVWRNNPALDDWFHRLNFKRFIGSVDPRLSHLEAAAQIGGAMAVAKAKPPKGGIEDIVRVLASGRTFLLMTDTAERRDEVGRLVDEFIDRRDGKKRPALPDNVDIGPVDGAHRGLVIIASDWD